MRKGGKRSKFEYDYAKRDVKKGAYESDKIQYTISCTYNPDFTYIKKDGSKLFIELKGLFKASDRRKTLAILDQHRGIDLRFLFQRAANKITKGSKTTYGMWCDKHNIKWAEGLQLPANWLNEIQ
jgi:hypothetical protein